MPPKSILEISFTPTNICQIDIRCSSCVRETEMLEHFCVTKGHRAIAITRSHFSKKCPMKYFKNITY